MAEDLQKIGKSVIDRIMRSENGRPSCPPKSLSLFLMYSLQISDFTEN